MKGVVLAILACALSTACVTERDRLKPATNAMQPGTCLECQLPMDEPNVLLHSLDEIPEPVRTNALAHVRTRAGDFEPRLSFAAAQRVPGDAGSDDYLLEFRFSDTAAGISRFDAQMRVRSDGTIAEPLALPDFRAAPARMHFVSIERVQDVARANGFRLRLMQASLTYHRANDSIAWSFTQPDNPDANAGKLRVLTVSAHSGEILPNPAGESVWFH